nr:MAG TPA: hypothetical protein [Caudoviricetes sp.]DAU01106.1 MAG TPA: hypothetical protein [Caudoviricetes sp.]
MWCGFGSESWYSLAALCGAVRLFSTRLRVCVEWVGDSFVPFRPVRGWLGFCSSSSSGTGGV